MEVIAPVVIFVFNRPNHTKKTIEALAKNKLAKETEVYIFADAARSEKTAKEVEQVRLYIDSLPQKNYFKSLHINKAKLNKGLAKSVISGVSQIIDQYGKVIVVEDDLISSVDFLSYMNDALSYYQENEKIWSISGFNIPIEIPSNYKSDIYLSYRGCSWGWATWKDRWEQVDWEVKDYNNFKKDKAKRRRFNRGGLDMANMLDFQMEGKIDSWAIRWCYTQSKLDMLTVYPVESRIQNTGLDGSGTHHGLTSKYDTDFKHDGRQCKFDDPGLNKRIIKNFKRNYISYPSYFLMNFKKVVKKILRK